ncbi:kinase-like domain-containing protein [Microdochium trichocladiopsis]|uniref:non-specific serine/threonine protein kinase n=1 Tax=Microdochium trichocladiopsis TaxID=1682393 RepID=A0A9P8YCW5_9PEZI|nr:kinase-like domain-containing protein [Microdochium trichocladiopsis]KAH7035600.1 kinase-like domain-containing protein [Microdochium trichocladiopsis]
MFRSAANRLNSVRGRFSSSKATSPHTFVEESLARYSPGGYHPKNKIVCKLGYGLYSTVWLAFDQREKRHFALKILTADSYDGKHDTFEMAILKKIKSQSANIRGPGPQSLLGLVGDFEHTGPHGKHTCLVFEAMGLDMSKFRRLFPRACIPVPLLKDITRQLLSALALLHDTCKVIHCDIKPQNLLIETPKIASLFSSLSSDNFVPQRRPLDPPHDFYMESMQVSSAQEDLAQVPSVAVRLADFGTASWVDRHLTEWIQPQMLRAPEVILGAPWDHKVDVWNLGLIIWEFAEGSLVFDGTWTATAPYSSEAHLAQMQAVLGSMPQSLLTRSKHRSKFFREDGTLREPSPFPHTPLESICRNTAFDHSDKALFLDFIARMIQLEPQARPDARELLLHEWLKQ